jgi:hypothetical protein
MLEVEITIYLILNVADGGKSAHRVTNMILYTSVHGKSIQVLREIFVIFWLCKFT